MLNNEYAYQSVTAVTLPDGLEEAHMPSDSSKD